MNKLTGLAMAALLLAPLANLHSAETSSISAETKEHKDQRMRWFREARFGMFIHWGVYAQLAGSYQGKRINPGGCSSLGEWIMLGAKIPLAEYKQIATQFNPDQFDADSWVRIAKDAGMRYIVITAKHHDGFAMYHTAVDRYNISDATPFKRDPIAELAAACNKAGMKFGVYYSQNLDWSHPGGGAMSGPRWDPAQEGDYDAYIKNVSARQVDELITRFHPAVLWFDIPKKNLTPDQVGALMAAFPKNPDMIYNNRMGGGIEGDIETPEQTIPANGFPGRDWESCMTINDTWGYKSYDTNFKPTARLLRDLVDIASKGGNYLLNVGPDDKGLIPAPEVERLAEMGKWTKENAEAIYGTTASPFRKNLLWGRATKRPGKLYLHVFDWPEDGNLAVPGLKNTVTKAYRLTDPAKTALAVNAEGESQVVMVGGKAPDPTVSVIVLEIEGDPNILELRIKPAEDGTLAFRAASADLHEDVRLQGAKTSFNIGCWMKSSAWVSWDFTGATSGTYEVVAEIGSPDDSSATLEIGTEKLPIRFKKTNGYNDYQHQVLGRIRLDCAGDTTAFLRPDKEGWKAVNVRQIMLRPEMKP